MKILITMVLTTAAMLSLNANSATVTTQVQKMSFVSSYYDPSCDYEPTYCDPYTVDYSNDGLFYTFTATWDDATSTLNGSVSDGNSFQFTDGYYDDGYGDYGYYSGYSEGEYVTIDVTDGEITSFQASYNYTDDMSMTSSSSSWVYDGNELVRTYYDDDSSMMSYSEQILSYDVINPSPVPLPAGIYLFLSGLVGLSAAKSRGKIA